MSEATTEKAPIAVTVAEAARMLSVSTATMRRMVNSGAVDHCRPTPGTVRVLVASIERHVRATTVRGSLDVDPADFRHVRPKVLPGASRLASPSRP